MNILFGSSELSPYAKTGGLGDVLAALPAALKRKGHSVSCVLPFYKSVADKLPLRKKTRLEISVRVGSTLLPAVIWEAVTQDGVKLFLVQRDEFFDRSHLYGTPDGDYVDNAARFIFFNRAIIELARYIDPLPDILHLHDWQTGLVPAMVRAAALPYRTVFTIHNLAYQGSFWGFDFDLANLPGEYFSPPGVEFYGRLNCMKAGIALANQITTVSPRYAREIQTVEYGCALDRVLVENSHKLTGILNGVDEEIWNPRKDSHLPAAYSARSFGGKDKCRKALCREFGINEKSGPLFGCVARFTAQKGFDLIAQIIGDILREGGSLMVLGSGDATLENYFREMAARHPGRIAVRIGFDEGLAHRIEAGCDFFLMPSQFEPCGLNQMYSLRYGTVPIVHDTGGLSDSVDDWNEGTGRGTGIKFSPYTAEALRGALAKAGRLFSDKKALVAVRRAGMKRDFSWDESATKYEEVYRKAMG